MPKCMIGHPEVTFRGGTCPACQIRENLTTVAELLQEEIKGLTRQLEDLQDQLTYLGDGRRDN